MKKLIMIAALAFLVALLAMPVTIHAAGSQSIARTFQPSTIDSWLDQQNTATNYGSATTMTVRSWAAGPNIRNKRSVVQFDFSQIPSGSTNISATLSLYASSVPSAIRTYYAHRITTSWAEGTVTWNSLWTTAGGDYATSTVSATTPATAGWMDFTVTGDVADFVAGTHSNYGWLIKDGTEDDANLTTTFYTRDEPIETTLRPKLVVTYTAPWDSYESDYSTIDDNYDTAGDTIYMKGTGFAAGNYKVRYYDAGAVQLGTDAGITVSGDGILQSLMACNTNPSATAGTWHAKVFDDAGTTLIADDTFAVTASAIPEFPTVIAAIGVAGLCFGIYFWMRKRRLAYVKA